MTAPRPGSQALYLGLDAGSTLCKAAVCDVAGGIVAHAQVPSPQGSHGARPGQAAPDAWWRATCDAARAALTPLDAKRVRAVGLSCRYQAGILLDGGGAVVAGGPAPFPRRGDPIVQEVYQTPGWGDGGPLACGYAPLLISAAVWFRRRHPDLFRRACRVGALRDYLTYRLCGAWVTDFATGPGGPVWPSAALELLGLSAQALPVPRPMHARAGRLTAAAASDLGMSTGVTVAVGAQDGACAVFGAGAFEPGDGCITLSTNAVVRIVTGKVIRDTFGYPIAPSGAWAWVRGCPGAGRFLDTVVAALDGRGVPAEPERHAALAAGCPAAASSCAAFALPEDDPARVQAQIGRLGEAGWTPPAIYAAAVDAVLAEVARLTAEARAVRVEARRYVLTGGLTAVDYLGARLQPAIDRPIAAVVREAAAIGAARLAALASDDSSCRDSQEA